MGFPGGASGEEPRLPLQETQIQSLGWEDPLEEGMTTHASILAWRIPEDSGDSSDRGAWRATVHEVTKSKTRLKQLSMHMQCKDYS